MFQYRRTSIPYNSMQPNQMIWQSGYHSINLTNQLSKLYAQTKQKDRKLYNIRLYDDTNSINPGNMLTKNKLHLNAKRYITCCFLALNWEYVSIQNLETYLSSLPSSQFQPDQIRYEMSSLKLTKLNKALKINLLTRKLEISDNQYFLDSFDRKGKYQSLPYYPSLCQLTVNHQTHRFDGLIRLVESCQLFMAVVTYQSVYIIGLKEGMKVSRFSLKQCIDVKWCERGLYYLQKDGHLGLIQRQTTYIEYSNQFFMGQIFALSVKELQFVPQRIAVIGKTSTNHSLILLAICQSNPHKILLQVVNSSKSGMRDNSLIADLESHGDILYKNLLVLNGKLTLAIISGEKGNPERYQQYKFETV